jgi:hypothetical protein
MTILLDPPLQPSLGYRPELHWKQIIYSEIVSVTTTMRRNQRWNNEVTHLQPPFISSSTRISTFLESCQSRKPRMGSLFPNPPENHLIQEFTKLKWTLSTVSNSNL